MLKEGNGSVTNTILREFVYDSETSYPTGVSVINGKTRTVEANTINTSNLSVNVTDEFFSYSPRGEVTARAAVSIARARASSWGDVDANGWP